MRARARGFSLLELIVVLALLALAVSLIYVNLDGLLPSTRLGAASREVAATIAYARREAALRGSETAVSYDPRAGVVTAMVTEKERLVPSDFSATMPEGISITGVDVVGGGGGSTVVVRFSPTGGGASHVVHLKGEGALEATIEVHGLTGLVTVHDGRVRLQAPVEDPGR